jgi:hypothetical protein
MLQFRLQRIDSSVPAETDLPDEPIKRFERKSDFLDKIKDYNPVIDGIEKEADSWKR